MSIQFVDQEVVRIVPDEGVSPLLSRGQVATDPAVAEEAVVGSALPVADK